MLYIFSYFVMFFLLCLRCFSNPSHEVEKHVKEVEAVNVDPFGGLLSGIGALLPYQDNVVKAIPAVIPGSLNGILSFLNLVDGKDTEADKKSSQERDGGLLTILDGGNTDDTQKDNFQLDVLGRIVTLLGSPLEMLRNVDGLSTVEQLGLANGQFGQLLANPLSQGSNLLTTLLTFIARPPVQPFLERELQNPSSTNSNQNI